MYNTNGLSDNEVKENRKKYGNNEIYGKNNNTFFNLFIETLGDPIIKILLIALAVKTIFLFKDFDYFETIGIVIAILVAAFISAISEYGSNKAFSRMQEESSKIRVIVKRNNKEIEISIDDVVVGDLLILNSGNMVAADGILVEGLLEVNESSLNGETAGINKEKVLNINNAFEKNKVYRGTTIYDGRGIILVTNVGMNTLYGKMAKELNIKEEDSPLKIRLNNLAKIISKIGYISAIIIALSYLFSKIFILNNFNFAIIKEVVTFNKFLSYLLEALTLAVSVLVMSVPEGLPMMITLVLSTNSKKMLKDNVLVRKMVGIETAGSLNVLFTDKTGTITKGKMEVVEVLSGNLDSYYLLNEMPSKYKRFLIDGIIYNSESYYDTESKIIIGGNITDKALLSFTCEERNRNIHVIDSIPFKSSNKYAISIIKKDNEKIKLIKGAPDKIINYCDYYIDINGNKKILDKSKLLSCIEEKTARGLRAVAISYSLSTYAIDSLKRSILIGVIFIKDDIRSEAKESINLIKNAGINVIMVTGDSLKTATSIASDVGIINNNSDICITSNELKKMSDDEVKRKLPNIKVVARSMPEDKKRLVTIAKELNLVVGMTGDGVNDSIALKKADVSFAMGSGTEVAKEASDIVILDDNIKSIAKAILYGRTTFKNIRKFIIFQLSVNLSATMLALIGPFIGIPTPITVIQMLWINMVMDTLAGLAFSYEVPRIEYMEEKPKNKDENIITKYMFSEIILSGLYILTLCLLFLKLNIIKSFYGNHHMTAFFSLFIFLSVFNSFNARTHRINIFSNLKENKVFILIIIFILIVQFGIIYLNINIFDTTSLRLNEIFIVLVIATSILPFDFVRKILSKKFHNLKNI